MNQIQELPGDRTFGLDFNYASWTAGTVVTLCQVPWNSDYRDIVRFADQAALDSFIDNAPGPRISLDRLTYANPGEPVRIDLPLNAVYPYNYVRVQNPAQPISGDVPKSFYYFITEPRRLSPNATQVNVQLDVWQTFGYGVSFGNCYIERGHIGVANEASFTDYGRQYLTVPEGLDVGGEYTISKRWSRNMATARDNSNDPANPGGSLIEIMVISNVSFVWDDYPASGDQPAGFGTKDDPRLVAAKGSNMENLPNGSDIYIFNRYHFDGFLKYISTRPWISQGIIAIMAIPLSWQFGVPSSDVMLTPLDQGGYRANRVPGGTLKRTAWQFNNAGSVSKTGVDTAWRNEFDLGRYSNLKKFFTYPYMVMELTTNTGTPIVIKPESWQDPYGTIVEVPHLAPPASRIMMYPYRYNASDSVGHTEDSNGIVHDGGEFVDFATGIMNFPTFSILNNGGISLLASQANSIAFAHSSADWSQQRAITGARNSYTQASSGINASNEINRIGISASQRQTSLANETAGYNALAQGATGLIGAAGRGDGVGALTGVAGTAANYAIQTNQNSMSNSIATGASAATNRAQMANAGYVRDTNLDYANFAASGDYENTIAGIQAKVQDAALVQPTTSGQVGGDAFLLAQYQWGWEVRLKTVSSAAMRAIGEYWLRYGYQVNQFLHDFPDNFMVMEKFTYWKLRETYITGAQCPEHFKQTIRGIFEKGVTVWSDPAYIGTIDIADNAPLAGVTL